MTQTQIMCKYSRQHSIRIDDYNPHARDEFTIQHSDVFFSSISKILIEENQILAADDCVAAGMKICASKLRRQCS